MTQWKLRWVGHVAKTSDVRHPKRLLFGWFPQKHPAHGAKLRWRDKVRQDLKKCGITVIMVCRGSRSCQMEIFLSRWMFSTRDGTTFTTIYFATPVIAHLATSRFIQASLHHHSSSMMTKGTSNLTSGQHH